MPAAETGAVTLCSSGCCCALPLLCMRETIVGQSTLAEPHSGLGPGGVLGVPGSSAKTPREDVRRTELPGVSGPPVAESSKSACPDT